MIQPAFSRFFDPEITIKTARGKLAQQRSHFITSTEVWPETGSPWHVACAWTFREMNLKITPFVHQRLDWRLFDHRYQ